MGRCGGGGEAGEKGGRVEEQLVSLFVDDQCRWVSTLPPFADAVLNITSCLAYVDALAATQSSICMVCGDVKWIGKLLASLPLSVAALCSF